MNFQITRYFSNLSFVYKIVERNKALTLNTEKVQPPHNDVVEEHTDKQFNGVLLMEWLRCLLTRIITAIFLVAG